MDVTPANITVEFTVSERESVYIVRDGKVTRQEQIGPLTLESVGLYEDDGAITTYDRGDFIEEENVEIVRSAAEAAGIVLDDEGGDDLRVPGGFPA